MNDNCVCCGDLLPEDRMVCPTCERYAIRGIDKKSATGLIDGLYIKTEI